MVREVSPRRAPRSPRPARVKPAEVPARTKFILHDLAGHQRAHYLVERRDLEITAAPAAAPAHSILVIDRSGSMRQDLRLLKDTLLKVLTLEEYRHARLHVSLISYASRGDVQVHFRRVPIQDVMKPGSVYRKEVRKIEAGARSCLSQALEAARSLVEPGELTAITVHSDGYADDPSPHAEERALDRLCRQLQPLNVFLNAIAYSERADFLLLSRLASCLSGTCVRAGDLREVYDALARTSRQLSSTAPAPHEEPLGDGASYQVFVSHAARRVLGAAGPLRIYGLRPGEDAVIYQYRPVTGEEYERATDYQVAPTSEPVYAFARARLAQGDLNAAKFALASTRDATLTARYARALTGPELADLAAALDEAIFEPAALRGHDIRKTVSVPERLSVLEVLRLLDEHRDSIIVNRAHLQEHYSRRGVQRVPGSRDEQGNLVKPWLKARPLNNSPYAHIQSVDVSHHAADVNLLLTQRVQLVDAAHGTPITEVAGVLLDELNEYHAYTVVSDGAVNVPELRVKVSSPAVYKLLRGKEVLERAGAAPGGYDFHAEYAVRLDDRPLVPLEGNFAGLEGVVEDLARVRVLMGLFSCCLKEEPEPYSAPQLEELQRHYLSRNLYVNFPTTTPYRDLQEALAEGSVDSRVSYRVHVGTAAILSLDRLYSANEFLQRRYEAFDRETGRKLAGPTCDQTVEGGVRWAHKPLSPRVRLTGADELMQRLYDDYLGIDYNGSVAAVLAKVGADGLRRLLLERRNGGPVGRDEMVEAIRPAVARLKGYSERLYREKVSPLVFYVGTTGLLPDGLNA
ncbi:MAG TPA: vWA domain-containing protein, partial [Gemmataceae bacterium]|nr:vWA domain-containing protein [Gemmataceae bacterium]